MLRSRSVVATGRSIANVNLLRQRTICNGQNVVSCASPPGRKPGLWHEGRMFFLDSSEENEIRDIFAWGVVAGVTTNPLILAREAGAADLEQRIRAVVAALKSHRRAGSGFDSHRKRDETDGGENAPRKPSLAE